VSVSLEQLRGQDEPFWTAVAVLTAGLVETAMGRHDDALDHLHEARDLAERFDNAGLAAWSQVQLGTLAVIRGRLEEAQALLDEALTMSLATHSTRNVTLSLAAFAQLALVEGDPERAALLAGAAEGLRRRVGLRAWPLQRQGEAQLVAQVRQALGRTGSTRRSPPVTGSTAAKRWPPSATTAAPQPPEPRPAGGPAQSRDRLRSSTAARWRWPTAS
jgi:ATP/maltotriose-dependent transcriptional regulator MalT